MDGDRRAAGWAPECSSGGWDGLRDGLAATDVQEWAAFEQEGAALVPATATHMTRPHTHTFALLRCMPTATMDGGGLWDGLRDVPAQNRLRDGPAPNNVQEGAALAPATAKSSCIGNKKSDGYSPAILEQDAIEGVLVDTIKMSDSTEPMLPLSNLAVVTPKPAIVQLTSEEKHETTENSGFSILCSAVTSRLAEESEEKKARLRERVKRSRVKNRFVKQIDKGFKTVEREILDGGVGIRDVAIGRNDLRIIKVWQRSEMKEIKAYGTNGKRLPHFRGAIVSHDDDGITRYRGVPEALFMGNVPCWAKHGSQRTATWIHANKKTGVVDGHVLVAWDSKPNKWQWIPEHRVLDIMTIDQTKRTTAGPDRFEPGTTGVGRPPPTLHKSAIALYDEYYQSDIFKRGYYTIRMMIGKVEQYWIKQKERERVVETMIHKIKKEIQTNVALWNERLAEASENGIRLARNDLVDYLGEKRTLPEQIRQNIGFFPPCPRGHGGEGEKKKYEEEMQMYEEEEKKLISEALKAWKANTKTPDPNRPIQTTPLENPNIVLSLTYDVIRWNIAGSLGKEVDAELGVSKDKKAEKYMNLMVSKVVEVSIQDRAASEKAKRKAKKRLCKSEGCGKWAWNESRSGHCYEHADPSTKLCRNCKVKTRKYAGGLCVSCKPPSSGKREKVWCPDCGVREPARRVSRCIVCIGSSFGGRKKAVK